MRVKGGPHTRRRHKKVLKMTKGHHGVRHSRFRAANESLMHALKHAYVGRKLKKRDFRKLWIVRINAALRKLGLTYSVFMGWLKKQNIQVNRKVLADMAFSDFEAFKNFVEQVKGKAAQS